MRRNELPNSIKIEDVSKIAGNIRESVQKVIVGKDEAINLGLLALFCGGHILMEDVPGIGKTTMAKALAQSLGCSFKRIQCTPDLMPSDVVGVNLYNQKTAEFDFSPGPIFSQVLLTDEINRATPRTQSALLEAMQEQQVTVDGNTSKLSDPFLVMATQNPVEMEGTFPLPEAQLDRFMLLLKLGYPTPEEESDIFLRFEKQAILPDLSPVISAEEIIELRKVIPTVRVEDKVRNYIVEIVGGTRDNPSITLGASPRAGLALYKGAQALAAIDGRDYVTPDDIKSLTPSVLPHRIILSSTARLQGNTTDQVIEELLNKVPVPISA